MKYAALAAALLAVLACGSPHREDESQNAPTQSTTTPNPGQTSTVVSATTPQQDLPGNRVPPAAPQTVEVQLTEYAIRMPQSLAPGKYTLHIANAGKEDHSFVLEGNEAKLELTEPLKRGNTKDLTADLRAGSYNAWCPVDKHKDHGMTATLVVK